MEVKSRLPFDDQAAFQVLVCESDSQLAFSSSERLICHYFVTANAIVRRNALLLKVEISLSLSLLLFN